MNKTMNSAVGPQEGTKGVKPLRSERLTARGVDLKKKKVRTGTYAAGGLLALVGLAAVLLG